MVDKIFKNFEGFQWDSANATKNYIKHNVTEFECEQVFFNRPLLIETDEKHSKNEKRYFVLGKTDLGRKLFIVFTARKRLLRIISARDMSRREREVYNEKDSKI